MVGEVSQIRFPCVKKNTQEAKKNNILTDLHKHSDKHKNELGSTGYEKERKIVQRKKFQKSKARLTGKSAFGFLTFL